MSSSSTDDTPNEEKEEKMKRFSKLRHMIRKKRELRLKKKSKKPMQMISMSSSQLRRISNSKTKERPKSLKEHLIEYLKEKKYIEDIKAKIEKKEEQKIEERYLDYNEDRSKVKVKAKEIRDFKQERHNRTKKINKKQNIPLSRRPLKKRNKKGIDKNGNILKSYPYNTSSNLVQQNIQPKLDIDLIVDKCANEFKTSIKNIIAEYANSVTEPNSVNNNGIDESTSKEIQRHDSTNDEILKPYSDWSTDSDNQSDIMTQEDEDLEIQESNYFKIYLEKKTHNNLYRIDNEQFQKNRLYEKYRFGESFRKEEDVEWDRLIEERRQNLEMGRKIFENAYRFLEHSEDDDEENEIEQKQSVTDAKDKVSKKRRNISSKNPKRSKKMEEKFVDSHKKKSETDEIDVYIDVGMVTPRDMYLSSLPQYSEYRTEVHVPKSCIEDDLSNIKYSAQNDDEIKSSEYSDKEEICKEESQASTERPVSKHYQEKPSDHKTTKNIETENINEKYQKPTLNVMTTVITEFMSSIRQIYEKGKRKKEKNRSYQDLEKERVNCQKRIDRELAFFRRLTEQQYSDITSSSEEFTDDEDFVKNKKSLTEVSGRAEKRKFFETKRSSSPILIYHYYRPGCKSNEEATYYDSDGCIQNLESENPFKPHKELKTPRTLGSENNNEADAKISEERKSNTRSLHSLPSESENRELVLNQLKKEEEEETLEPGLRNTNKSKTSNEKLKIHYEPMTITFDARSNTKPKL